MATLLPSLVLTASSLISLLQAPKRDIIIITPLISFYLSSSAAAQPQIQPQLANAFRPTPFPTKRVFNLPFDKLHGMLTIITSQRNRRTQEDEEGPN